MTELQYLARQVIEMLDRQKTYFETRSGDVLTQCKVLAMLGLFVTS